MGSYSRYKGSGKVCPVCGIVFCPERDQPCCSRSCGCKFSWANGARKKVVSALSEELARSCAASLLSGGKWKEVAESIGLSQGAMRSAFVRYGLDYQKPSISTSRLKESGLRGFTLTDLAYLAGMVDADGSIACNSDSRSQWLIYVYNNDEAIMGWCLKRFGGSVCAKRASAAGRFKNAQPHYFNWTLARQADVYLVLFLMREFLVLKKSKADSAIAFLEDKYGFKGVAA